MNYLRNLLLICIIFLACSTCFAQAPQWPTFEESFTEVRDIVFTDDSGWISIEIPYLDGEELLRRVRAVTVSGYEFLIISKQGSDMISIYSPGVDVTITNLSSSSARIKNLNTGEEWVETLPPGHTGFDPINLPAPQAEWQHELLALATAYEASQQSGGLAQSHPLKWYSDGGFVIPQTEPSGCNRDHQDCGRAIVTAYASTYLWGAGCLLGTVVSAGSVSGPICGLGAISVGFSLGDVFRSCECVPYEIPDPETPTPPPPPSPSPSPCPPSVCSNTFPGFPSPGLACGCELILRQPGYPDRCLEYGCR